MKLYRQILKNMQLGVGTSQNYSIPNSIPEVDKFFENNN